MKLIIWLVFFDLAGAGMSFAGKPTWVPKHAFKAGMHTAYVEREPTVSQPNPAFEIGKQAREHIFHFASVAAYTPLAVLAQEPPVSHASIATEGQLLSWRHGGFFPFNFDYVTVDLNNANRYTFKNLRLIPIRAKENFRQEVGNIGYYISLQEAMDANLVAVNEVNRNGQVNTLLVRNLSQDTLYIMSGEILVGGKQDRVVANDILIPPNNGATKLNVFCVEEGRWKYLSTDARFTTYYGMANEHIRGIVDQRGANQGAVWAEVAKSNKLDGVVSKTKAYTAHATHRRFRQAEREYINFFQHIFEGQDDVIGVLAVTDNVIEGADLFVSNRLFMQEFQKLIYAYTDDALAYGAPVRITQSTIDHYVNQLLNPQTQVQFVEEKGQAFTRGNQVIHIAVY